MDCRSVSNVHSRINMTGSSYCSAVNCSSSKNKTPGKKFFRFPRDKNRCKRWIINSRRADLLTKGASYCYQNCRLCADHFEQSQFIKCPKRSKLISNAVPTIFDIPNLQIYRPTLNKSTQSETILTPSADMKTEDPGVTGKILPLDGQAYELDSIVEWEITECNKSSELVADKCETAEFDIKCELDSVADDCEPSDCEDLNATESSLSDSGESSQTKAPLTPEERKLKQQIRRLRAEIDSFPVADRWDPNVDKPVFCARSSSEDDETSPLTPEEIKLKEQIRRQRAEIESFPFANCCETTEFDNRNMSESSDARSSSDDETKAPVTPKEKKQKEQIRRLRAKLARMKRRIETLQTSTKRVSKRYDVNSLIEGASRYLSSYALEFFACQLRLYSNRFTKRKFNDPMKAIALSLYHKSPKAYGMCERIFVLPTVASLKRWLSELRTKPQFNPSIFDNQE